jgi:Kef-type K+ transport system membrane component KefB
MSRSPTQGPREDAGLVGRLSSLGVILLLVSGVTVLTLSATPPFFQGGRLTILMGFVLLVASVAGSLASSTGLPRLTGFLLVGILAGPSVLGIVDAPAVDDLRLIDEFALALIAMLAGGELRVQALRPKARTILLTTLTITGVVWIGFTGVVMAVSPLLPFLAGLPLAGTLGVALLLGIWGANSSPDLTVAVMEETGQKGDLAEVILGITIVKDVVVIILFTLTLALVAPLVESGGAFRPHVVLDLLREVGGAVVVGGIMGWFFSLYLGGETDEPKPPLATFLFAYLVVVIAHRLHVELLLTGVAAGFVIENLSPAGDRMIRGIESVAVVIFAVFFAIAGASLDLGAVRRFWLAAVILFAARILLTWAGTAWGMRWAGASTTIRRKTWQGLVSQGGVTLGLAILIQERFPSVGDGVVALAMAVIIGNILGGPVILKRALAAPGRESGGGTSRAAPAPESSGS